MWAAWVQVPLPLLRDNPPSPLLLSLPSLHPSLSLPSHLQSGPGAKEVEHKTVWALPETKYCKTCVITIITQSLQASVSLTMKRI